MHAAYVDLHGVDPYNDDDVAADMALGAAASAVDAPHDPAPLLPEHRGHLRHGWDGEPPRRWLARVDGQVVGGFGLTAPERDNLHMAHINVVVHPDVRGRGFGRELYEHCLDQVRAAGRRLVVADTADNQVPIGFVERRGFKQASVEVQRRQDLRGIDWGKIEELNVRAREAAVGYSLVSIEGPVPAELLDDVAVMTAAINDAPTDDLDIEDEVFDAKRIRAFEHAQQESGNRLYRIIARRDEDGALAGHTMLGLPVHRDEWAWQFDTSVLSAHRGHRLGMLLKSQMMLWLRDACPNVRWVDTWNAETNGYMIAVNESLGYQVMARYLDWQRGSDHRSGQISRAG